LGVSGWELHHKELPVRGELDDSRENVIALCERCHLDDHREKAAAAREARQRALYERRYGRPAEW
jgi:hypothetical protein